MLAACTGTRPTGDGAFRDSGAPIWSAAAFDPSRIEGPWQQVASYQTSASGSCRSGRLDFRPVAGGLAVSGVLCLNGSLRKVSGRVAPAGPGRLAISGQEDWWILWVDSGYRTLAVGTPSGRFGFVLDRGQASPDRLTAAREVFDFNGYSSGSFRPF